MAKLTTAARKKIPKKEFGLPEKEAYPVEDRKHAINAKGRATQMVKKHKLSKPEEKRIDAKADKVIYKKKGKK